ncbi:Sister chromatid cohesion 1 protein 3 [Hordeum vulgare]|nr:Sister chromatid cohesion 1 protein 3 [Hordeum vulgare]
MFYSHSVLARKSPLGTVWIAAHLERKVISRTQIDGVHVPSYAESIMDPEVPIALRLSAHLLLGLVRIYSWKVNHLFQDCNRMLSAVRTAAAFAPAGADIDLPSDADRAPFAAITLPATFSLDDWNLDDAIRLIESPDNHRRPADEITLLSGEAGYVMVTLDEDGSSSACRSLRFEPGPHEQETFPPFPEDRVSVDLPPPQDSLHTTGNGHQDPPEISRRATDSATTGCTDGGGSDTMDEDPRSPFMEKVTTPRAMSPSGRGSPLPGTSIPDVPIGVSHDHDHMEEDEKSGGTGILVPAAAFVLAPSPPPVQGNKRRRAQNPRIDEIGVLSNDDMRSQVHGDELQRLVRRRKPLPHTALDTWKFNKRREMDSLLPLVEGMCTDLHKAYEWNYPRVSDSDADVANTDAPAPPVNADTHEPEPHLTPVSSQEPEPHLTPISSENGEATPINTTPELPRFSRQMDLSTVREEDDSPFIKTPAGRTGTPGSGLGGTGATATATHGSYATPGQNTRESDPNGSQFPFGDDYLDEDLPEIPGLINTPSATPSADTGARGLSSMSTKTRAAAKYFKGMMMSSATSQDQQRGKFSLNIILDGRTRKQAASMFFETLALKSCDYIDVLQEEAYGDISVSVRPSLSSAKL